MNAAKVGSNPTNFIIVSREPTDHAKWRVSFFAYYKVAMDGKRTCLFNVTRPEDGEIVATGHEKFDTENNAMRYALRWGNVLEQV